MDSFNVYSGSNISSTIQNYAAGQLKPTQDYILARTGLYEYVMILDPEINNNTASGESYIIYHVDPNNNYSNYYWETVENDVQLSGIAGQYVYGSSGSYARLPSDDQYGKYIFLLLCAFVIYHLFKRFTKSLLSRLHRNEGREFL